MFSFLKNFCQKTVFFFPFSRKLSFIFFGLIFPTSMDLLGLPLTAQGGKKLPFWPSRFGPSPLQGFLHLPRKRSAAAVRDTIPDPSGHLAWQKVTVPISTWERAPRFVCRWASGRGKGCIQRREPVLTSVGGRRQSPDRSGSWCSEQVAHFGTVPSATLSNRVLVLMEPRSPGTNCRLRGLAAWVEHFPPAELHAFSDACMHTCTQIKGRGIRPDVLLPLLLDVAGFLPPPPSPASIADNAVLD